MLDKKIITNKYNLNFNKLNKDIVIKVISDLHLCNSFDFDKLNTIEKEIFSSNVDYLFICGDIIDSTNFLYDNKILVKKYLNWFKKIALKVPIYIVKGNHDIIFIKKKGRDKKRIEDKKTYFFKELSKIPNIYLSNNFYLENLNIMMIEPDLDYYYENKNSKSFIIKELKNNKKNIDKLDENKLNILLIHSPLFLTDKEILNYTNKFDLVLSGHMHKGAIPFNLGNVIPGNFGLISPNKGFFPKNARGIKEVKMNNKKQYLIVSGGITKIQECTGKLQVFNHLFSMEMEKINLK